MGNISTGLSGLSSSSLSVQLTLSYNLFLNGNKTLCGQQKTNSKHTTVQLTYKIYLPLQTSEHKIRDEQNHCWYFPLRAVLSILEYIWSELTIYIFKDICTKISRKSLLIRKIFIQPLT